MDIASFGTIKLVIWDLDETFWRGTLTEGGMEYSESNHALVLELTKRGVMNSICSNNDFESTRDVLRAKGVWDYFIFPSIGWQPKGQAIAQIIEKAQLRAQNVLFLDDRASNLEHATLCSPELRTSLPAVLPDLAAAIAASAVTDAGLTRLKHYKILERRAEEKQRVISAGDDGNEQFLRESAIRIEIIEDPRPHLERIHELIHGTNQLNFTKKRISRSELDGLIREPDVSTWTVAVKDKFGDYGIVGFCAVRRSLTRSVAEHFLFSCRTLNMGVEQWVWHEIGRPDVDAGSADLLKLCSGRKPDWVNTEAPAWPSRTTPKARKLLLDALAPFAILPWLRKPIVFLARRCIRHGTPKTVVLKGGCMVDVIGELLRQIVGAQVTVEIGESDCHSLSIRTVKEGKVPEEEPEVLKWFPGWQSVSNAFRTRFLDPDVDVNVLELSRDYRSGLYRFRETDFYIPLAPFDFDLTRDDASDVVQQWWGQEGGAGPWYFPIYQQQEGLRWLRDNCTKVDDDTRRQIVLDSIEWLCQERRRRAPNSKLILIEHAHYTPSQCREHWRGLPREISRMKTQIRNVLKDYPEVETIDLHAYMTPNSYPDGNPLHPRRQAYVGLVKTLSLAAAM